MESRSLRNAPKASEPRRTLRFLCAEDNPVNARLLAALLGPLEAELVMVENGREAIDVWQTGDFDLVLMDICMPVVDGVAAAAEIRLRERKAGLEPTPIIAVTADHDDARVKTYLAVGMDAVVPKPIAPATLYAAIEFALRKPAYAPERPERVAA